MNKWELIRIGKTLIEEYERNALEYDFKDDRRWYELDDADKIRNKVKEILETDQTIEIDERFEHFESSYSKEYPHSAPLGVRREWFFRRCEFIDNCSLCGILSDEMLVNTGKDERFPDAFYRLTRFEEEFQNEFSRTAFLRCPQCGAFFQWINQPEMYGTGNNDNERLIRLSERVSRLLGMLFSDDQKETARFDTGEFFEDFSLDIFIKALKIQLSAAPQIAAHFVPELMRFLVKNPQNAAVSEFLREYISYQPERAREVLGVLRSLKSIEYSPLIALLLDCFAWAEQKN